MTDRVIMKEQRDKEILNLEGQTWMQLIIILTH